MSDVTCQVLHDRCYMTGLTGVTCQVLQKLFDLVSVDSTVN